MESIEFWTRFFGWCAAINIGFMLLITVFMFLFRGMALKLHGRMFGLDEQDLMRAYFQYLAQYKIVAIVFSIVPYLSLRLMF